MNETEQMMTAFKRLIHVLSTGKNRPFRYGDVSIHRAEVHILELIGKNQGITASGIGKIMPVTKGAISQTLKKLKERKLIQTTESESDRKIIELYLTKKGKTVLDLHEAREKTLIKKIAPELKDIDDDTLGRFTAVINHISDFADE